MSAESVRVKRLHPGARVPERATEGSTGYDLYACLNGPLDVGAQPVRVPTGIAIEAPPGFDVQIRPRSGLSSRGNQIEQRGKVARGRARNLKLFIAKFARALRAGFRRPLDHPTWISSTPH